MRIKKHISFFLQKVYGNSNIRESQIRMRVRWSGNICQFNVGFNIMPEKWDKEGNRCKRNITNEAGVTSTEINREISFLENTIEDLFKKYELNGEEPTKIQLKEDFNLATERVRKSDNNEDKSIELLLSQYVIRMSEIKGWEEGTICSYGIIKKHLLLFRPDLSTSHIDAKFMSDYYIYILRKMKNTSVRTHFAFLKSFLRWCTNEGHITNDWKRFNIEVKMIHRKKVVFLNWDELMRLYNYKFIDCRKSLDFCRDIFCFQCFTSLRFSDVMKLRKDDVYEDYIRVCTEKTDTELHIELNKYSREILEKYKDTSTEKIFPSIHNNKANDNIKLCCKMAGIDTPTTIVYYKNNEKHEETHPKYKLIGTHTGRRTFICNALRMGISPEIVMKWTGHSNYANMQPYIDVAREDKAKAMTLFNRD